MVYLPKPPERVLAKQISRAWDEYSGSTHESYSPVMDRDQFDTAVRQVVQSLQQSYISSEIKRAKKARKP